MKKGHQKKPIPIRTPIRIGSVPVCNAPRRDPLQPKRPIYSTPSDSPPMRSREFFRKRHLEDCAAGRKAGHEGLREDEVKQEAPARVPCNADPFERFWNYLDGVVSLRSSLLVVSA